MLKPQLGLNNPQVETDRFSLRMELFRITNSASWQSKLQESRVSNLWDVAEFRRFCRPFAPESAGPQPGIVIRFPTSVVFGRNFFGWPLGAADSALDPTEFATKIRGAGIWFSDYNLAGLSQNPRVYLVPVGMDVLRAPDGDDFSTRQWRVVDQKLPIPFPITQRDLQNNAWIPQNDSLGGSFTEIRRHSSVRAFHDGGFGLDGQYATDSRLIGRSIWNTEWMLIIPGGTLLSDPDSGLNTFINSVTDIKVDFKTYSYSGS